MGGRAERAAVDLGQAEGGVVGGHDDVGVADQADAAAEAEAVDRGDHRHRALVDRGERGEAAPVGADERASKPSVRCISLMSTPALKPRPSARRTTTCGCRVVAGGGDRVGELEPAARREGVDRRVVDGDRDDARFGGAWM